MTFLELVNKTLQRLREDTVTSTSDNDYAALIGDLVNETIREIEDAWDWNSLMTTIQITTIANNFRYVLTGANQRSKIMSVYDGTDGHKIWQMTPAEMTFRYHTEDVTAGSGATHYSQNGLSGDGTPMIDFYPMIETGQTIYVNIKIPREEITVDSTEVDMPYNMIVLGAYSKAIQERGEDMGTNLVMAEQKFQQALSDAIAIDQRISGSDNDWHV